VLVRSETLILHEQQGPLSIDVSLEYFPEKGMEVIPVRDRANWLLHKLLNSEARQLLIHIEPQTASILSMEEKTIADVLTSQDPTKDERGVGSLCDFENIDDANIYDLFHFIMDFCHATTKLDHESSPRNIICYPARSQQAGTCVASHREASVHKELSSIEQGSIDFMSELDDAHKVYLSPSFRHWSWSHDRMAYTFPLKEDKVLP
jgi:hypothetical protein